MILKNLKLIIPLAIISLVLFGIDKVFFNNYYPNIESSFKHSIQTIFGFFAFCSVLIIILLLRVKQKNINSVGQTFLLITSIKMGLSYILVKPILESISEISKIEKYHFLIIFLLFLIIETSLTIRLLNKDQ